MVMHVSSPKPGGLSSSDCIRDPDEKEISDDDDDRNHKHRRRETRSQSLERDTLGQVLNMSYIKRNVPFENGHPFRENGSQANGKFDKRCLGISGPQGPMDFNQRIRTNQMFPGDIVPRRGRGKDSLNWNQHDSRFGSADLASQIVHSGSIPPNLFAGRGLPNISNAYTASWSGFGLIPGVPNGGLDALHPVGLQGTLRQPINSLSIGVHRQRCRDFEERGFCLRGDICPMEHGVNRIVVEDVQSLSQFNLPVSHPNAHLLGTTAGPGSLPALSTSSTTLINSRGLHGRSSKPGVTDDSWSLNGAYSGLECAGGADLYDPDQPLWNSNYPETSNALLALQSAKIDEPESLLNECTRSELGTPSRGAGSSVWGRSNSFKKILDVKEKLGPTASSSGYVENEMEDTEVLASFQGKTQQGKHIVPRDDAGSKEVDLYVTRDGVRKPSQGALRTLFVNRIPKQNNKRGALLSHFRKFGEVIDIYIPVDTERAFVQFSKRVEAEAALKAPDAVMGNRFIKLWWATRDNIPDYAISSSTNIPILPRNVTTTSVPSLANRGKDNIQSDSSKGNIDHSSDVSKPAIDHLKPSNGPMASPRLQKKKLESLEQLKEELRKKQEMLDQKRNDFRRQLDKLAKQATGSSKAEAVTNQAAKRPKVGEAAHVGKVIAPKSSDPESTAPSLHTEIIGDKNNAIENVVSCSAKISTSTVVQEPSKLKQATGFTIVPPLQAGFANVSTLKEHFSAYGDLSTVELDDVEDGGSEPDASSNRSARITFLTNNAAERAFADGKCWQGNNLEFMWLKWSHTHDDFSVRENSPSFLKAPSDSPLSIVSKKESVEDEEPENLPRKMSVELLEADEECQCGDI